MLIFLGTEYTDQRWRRLISLGWCRRLVGRRTVFAKCTAPARGATANERRWQRYLPRPTAEPPLSPSHCQLLTQTLTTTREARNARQQRESTGRLRHQNPSFALRDELPDTGHWRLRIFAALAFDSELAPAVEAAGVVDKATEGRVGWRCAARAALRESRSSWFADYGARAAIGSCGYRSRSPAGAWRTSVAVRAEDGDRWIHAQRTRQPVSLRCDRRFPKPSEIGHDQAISAVTMNRNTHARMLLFMEQNVAADPETVGLFGTPTKMSATANGSHLVHETSGGRNSGQVTP